MNSINKNKSYLIKIIHESYLNERALENHLKIKHSISNNFFDFKVLQFSSYFANASILYNITILLCCIFFLISQILIGIILLFFSFFFLLIPKTTPKNLLSQTSLSYSLNNIVLKLNLKPSDFFNLSVLNLMFLVKTTRLFNYFFFIIKFSYYSFISNSNMFLLFLNMMDLFKQYLISVYLIDTPEVVIITDDHYQRNAYLFSKLCGENYIVIQHGYIDDSIKFPYKFGTIALLYLKDPSFLKSFQTYFLVKQNILLDNPSISFSPKDFNRTCFLASSSPFIDSEIKFLQLFKKYFNVKVIVKKHPKHSYNRSKLKLLLGLADYEWIDNEFFPNSKLFISYSSYLEFEYISLGSYTFKLSDYSHPEKLIFDSNFKTSVDKIQELNS